MQIFRDVKDFQAHPSRPLFLALGNFDGLHLGHQKILRRVISEARRRGGIAGVFTFRSHPEQILHPARTPKLLSSPEQKLFLLQSLGLEVCFWIEFTKKFSRFSAEAFVQKMLVRKLKVQKVFMGYNARFGHRRAGDAALMQSLGRKLGFEFEEIPPLRVAGDFISSSKIRQFVAAGRLQKAGQALGRPYSLWAKVIPGAGRGRVLGYPTANLQVSNEALPPHGVYPVACRILNLKAVKKRFDFSAKERGAWMRGVLNYGFRPTFKDLLGPQLEVFLLDFRGNLYGKMLEVVFYPRLRAEKTFPNADKLKAQIARDIQKAGQILRRALSPSSRSKERSLQNRQAGLY